MQRLRIKLFSFITVCIFLYRKIFISFLDDLDSKDFSEDFGGYSLLAISHQKLESDRFLTKYRFQKRKFLENIFGDVSRIQATKYRVMKNFISTKSEELSALKVSLQIDFLIGVFRTSSAFNLMHFLKPDF